MERAVRRLAVIATIGMFIVLMMGSSVTNTGSAEGCGKSWPLCHGEFIPEYAFETAVEYSHRLVTGVEGVLIAGTAVGALRIRRGSREVKVLTGLMVGTLLLQSGLGASAVMWPQSPAIMASHFGISLVCFASVFLLTRYLYWTAPENDRPGRPAAGAAGVAFPTPVRWAIILAVPFVIGVAYLGAYMRHSHAEMACYEWPRCTETSFLPTLTGPEGIAVAHRLAAVATALVVGGLAWLAYRRRAEAPGLARVLAAAFALVLLQAAAGGAVVLTRLDLWATLAHAALMALLFVCLADAARQVMPVGRTAPLSRPRLSPASGPAD